jgi:hypothetical protein
LKDLSFKERSFTLELPKPLILADVLVSALYPPFDNLTPLARYIGNILGHLMMQSESPNLTFFSSHMQQKMTVFVNIYTGFLDFLYYAGVIPHRQI